MVDSTADCACDQGAASARQIITVGDGLGKSFKEVGTSLWEDVVEGLIVVVLNVLEELLPALPHAIALGACSSNHSISAGSCCSSAVSQEAVMGSRGLICKLSGSWLGSVDERRETR